MIVLPGELFPGDFFPVWIAQDILYHPEDVGFFFLASFDGRSGPSYLHGEFQLWSSRETNTLTLVSVWTLSLELQGN